MRPPPSRLNDIAQYYDPQNIGTNRDTTTDLGTSSFKGCAQQEYTPSPSAMEVYKRRRAGQGLLNPSETEVSEWIANPLSIGKPLGRKLRNRKDENIKTVRKNTIGTAYRRSRVNDLKEPRSAYEFEQEAFVAGRSNWSLIRKRLINTCEGFLEDEEAENTCDDREHEAFPPFHNALIQVGDSFRTQVENVKSLSRFLDASEMIQYVHYNGNQAYNSDQVTPNGERRQVWLI